MHFEGPGRRTRGREHHMRHVKTLPLGRRLTTYWWDTSRFGTNAHEPLLQRRATAHAFQIVRSSF
jgi:hypothetical protein